MKRPLSSTATDPTVIGAFVVLAIALVISGTFAMGSWTFEEELKAVAPFRSSIAGLSIGSPVRFRGVEVGRVADIHAEWNPDLNAEVQDESNEPIHIFVTLALMPGKIRLPRTSRRPAGDDPATILERLIVDHGLYARLAMDGLVTGNSLVALDFDKSFDFVPHGNTEFVEIPTRSDGFFDVLGELDLQEMISEGMDAIRGISELVHGEDVRGALTELRTLLTHLREALPPVTEGMQTTLARTDAFLDEVGPDLNATLASLRDVIDRVDRQVEPLSASAAATLDEARTVFEGANALVARDSRIVYRLEALLGELTEAARSIQLLADYLERHPEAIVFGKGD